MEKTEIKHILSAPISFVREATPKETRIFRDKKGAWFYTFGLASGQQFVGAIFDHKDPRVNFRPIPEHNLLPEVQEILWGYDDQIYFGPGPKERCIIKVLVAEGISEDDREFYEEYLGAEKAKNLFNWPGNREGVNRVTEDGGRRILKSHLLRDTALEIKKCLIRQREAQKAISVAEKTLIYNKNKLSVVQKELSQILTPKKENHLIQQKLKERRQNG